MPENLSLHNDSHIIYVVVLSVCSSLCLWSVNKKKPVFTVKPAHEGVASSSPGENWITALAAMQHTDLIASGAIGMHSFIFH
jgi:hypothetical protein